MFIYLCFASEYPRSWNVVFKFCYPTSILLIDCIILDWNMCLCDGPISYIWHPESRKHCRISGLTGLIVLISHDLSPLLRGLSYFGFFKLESVFVRACTCVCRAPAPVCMHVCMFKVTPSPYYEQTGGMPLSTWLKTVGSIRSVPDSWLGGCNIFCICVCGTSLQ